MFKLFAIYSVIYILVGLLVLILSRGKTWKAYRIVLGLAILPYVIRGVFYLIEGPSSAITLEGYIMTFNVGIYEVLYFILNIIILPFASIFISAGAYKGITYTN